MKLSVHLILPFLSALVATASAREITSELISECGGRENVMIVPDGADETQYRHCVSHPQGDTTPVINRDLGKMEKRALLDKRACWHFDSFGCTDRFCWRRCDTINNGGAGKWCWTAWGDEGKGDWKTCNIAADCRPTNLGDWACGQSNGGSCPDCGCDCRAKDAYKNK